MPHLVNYRQQDCQEFLRLFLDSLSEDLCRGTKTVTLSHLSAPSISSGTSLSDPTDQLRLPPTQKVNSCSPRPSGSNQSMIPKTPPDKQRISGKSSGSPRSINIQPAAENMFSIESDENDIENNLPEATTDVATPATSEANKVSESAQKAWEAYYKTSSSIIADLFSGQLQSRIECCTCKNSSSCFDPFMELSLPIPESKSEGSSSLFSHTKSYMPRWNSSASIAPIEASKCSLQQCIDLFTTEEVLDGDNMYHCEKCNAKRRSIKKLYLYRLPDILLVQLKRFKSAETGMLSMMRSEKVTVDINFPVSELDLSKYLSPDRIDGCGSDERDRDIQSGNNLGSTMYDLFGVSHHLGSIHGGHYVAHVDVGVGSCSSKWMCFNDDEVRSIAPTNVAGPSAYILFYKLRR